MEFCDNNTKYIIPFDSVDMSLLPSLNALPKHQESLIPLWDTHNLQQRHEDCYYEFEIIQNKDSTDCETYCSSKDSSSYMETDTQEPTLSTLMCYICNINVPAVCMSEHLTSAKHKTFLKITEISLERVRKQMGANYKSENVPVGFSFCGTCVALIPEGDVLSHMKLKPHKNAELLDQLLSDLLKIYSESEEADDDASRLEASNSSKDSRKVVNVGGLRRGHSTNKVYDDSSRSNEVASKTIAGGGKRAVGTGKISTGRVKLDVDIDNTTGDGRLNFNAGQIITSGSRLGGNIATITTANGELDKYAAKVTASGKLCADASKANGIRKPKGYETAYDDISYDSSVEVIAFSKKSLACSPRQKDLNEQIINNLDGLLDDYIRNLDTSNYNVEAGEVNDLFIETQSGLHLRVTLANFHGLYALGKRHVLCFLCQTINSNIKRHIYSKHHLNNIQLAIDNNGIRELNDEKSHCVICNDIIESPAVHAFCNKDHNTKLMLSLVNDESDRLESGAQASATERTKIENNPIRIESKATDVKDSANTRSYTEAVKKPRKSSVDLDPVVVSGSPEKLCRVCYYSCNPADWETHIQSSEHKSNEALLPHHLLEYSIEHRTLKCKVCVTSIPLHSKMQHVDSSTHQSNYKKLLVVNNMMRAGHTIFCSACVTYMNVGDEFSHLMSAKHKTLTINTLASSEWVKGQEGVIKPHHCKVCLVNVPGQEIKTHENGARHKKNLALAEAKNSRGNVEKIRNKDCLVTPTQRHRVIRVTAKPTEVECKICSATLPNTTKNISEHLDGFSHKNNASSLETNFIKIYRDIHWCSLCEMQVPIGEQFLHKDNAVHAAKASVKDGTDEEKSTSKDTNSINPFLLNLLKQTENKGVLCCQVCGVTVPNSGSTLRMHFEGVRHRSMQAKLLQVNGLSGEGLMGEINCTICLRRFPSDDLLHHIELPRHVDGLGVLGTPADAKSKSGQKDQEAVAKSKSGQKEQEADAKSKSGQKDQEAEAKSKLDQKDQEADKSNPNQNDKDNPESKSGEEDEGKPEDSAGVKPKTEDHPCIVCGVVLTTNEANITLHNDGARHKANLRMMEENKILVIDDGCYCEACDTKFARDHINKHVVEPQHMVMLG